LRLSAFVVIDLKSVMTDPSAIHLSVIIPAYNEEQRLPATLEDVLHYLSAQRYRSEVLVVDDGSSDGTANTAAGFVGGAIPVRLCAHPDHTNRGKGAAVRLGMLTARGEFRLFMDADNSTSVDQIAGFWPFLEQGWDIVIGSRRAAGARIVVHQARHKEIAGRFGNWMIRMLAVPGVLDTQAGFKILTRTCVERIFPQLTVDRWGFDIEILAVARHLGYRIREVPIAWINSPASKVGAGSYFEVMEDVWRIRRNLKSGLYM
jgi:dolichyl-phosphate beta-glucosyltransferase